MKKKLPIILLIFIIVFALASCESSYNHIHKWSSYYDNGDGTHYRFCLKDASHKEYSGHNYSDAVVMSEATAMKCGKNKYTCKDCGYSYIEIVEPNGEHVFDRCVVSDEYLYKECGNYTNIYYKSCECGAYGNDNYIFEYSELDEEYSEVEYIKSNGNSYIDTGLNYGDYSVYYPRSEKRLPDRYVEVEYIEAYGNEYVDTGIPFDMENGSITVEYKSNLINQNGMIVASKHSDKNFWFYNYINENILGLYISNGVSLKRYLTQDLDLEKHIFTYKNKSSYFDGNLDSSISDELDFTSYNLCLFSWGNGAYPFTGRIYSFTMSNDSKTLIRNFVPCYDQITMEAGFFDLVSGTFFNNKGTGEFGIGSVVLTDNYSSRLPEDYQEVEYIESTGNQIIDTKVEDSINTTIECHVYIKEEKPQYLFGSTQVPFPPYSMMMYNGLYSMGKMEYSWETITYNKSNDIVLKEEIEGSKTKITINNETFTSERNSLSPSGNIYLFGYNNGTRHYGEGMKLYSFKIYQDGVLIRDYVPCYNKKTYEVGLYDLVTNEFYSNSGEGSFNRGTEVYNTSNPSKTTSETVAYSKAENTSISGSTVNCIKTDGWGDGGLYTDKAYESIRLSGDIGENSYYVMFGLSLTNGSYDYKHLYAIYASINGVIYIFENGANMGEYGTYQVGDTFSVVKIGDTIGYYHNGLCVKSTLLSGKVYGNLSFYRTSTVNNFECKPLITNESNTLLPIGYQQVEYIESTGLEKIDTGLTMNYDDTASYEMDGYILNSNNVGWAGTDYFLSFRDDNQEFKTRSVIRIDWKDGYNKCYSNNNLVLEKDFRTNRNTYSKIGIFALGNQSNSWYNSKGQIARIYKVTIVINDVIQRKLLPCYRTTDGEIGMYDIIHGVFYSNCGEGCFIKGSDVETTSRYVEYNELISSNGAYIELDYKPNNNTKVVGTFKSDNLDNNQTFFFGSSSKYKENGYECYSWNHNGYAFDINFGSNMYVLNNVKTNTIYKIALSNMVTGYQEGTNQVYKVVTNESFTSPNTLTIFAIHMNELIATSKANVSCYGFDVYEGDTLLYSLVPAKDIVSHECGMYDKVNNKFYAALGDGYFYAVGEKETISETKSIVYYSRRDIPEEYEQLTYIESNGNSVLDTKVNYDSSKEYKVIVKGSYTSLSEEIQLFGFSGSLGSSVGVNNSLFYGANNNLLSKNEVYDIVLNKKTNSSILLLNSFSKTVESKEESANHNILLLATYLDSESEEIGYYSYMKIYSTQIYVDNELIRDYIPCKSKITGRIGLYDCISGQFIYDENLTTSYNTELNIDLAKINLLYNDGYCNNTLQKGLISACYIKNSDGVVVRNFVPVIRNSDSVAGLYDLVQGKFYRSSSSVDFVAGPLCSHDLYDKVTIINPTYNTEGSKVYECKVCSKTITESIERTSYKASIISEIEDLVIREYYSNDESLNRVVTELYSYNPYSLNYSKVNSIIKFDCITESEYVVYVSGATLELNNGIYTIKDISSDLCIYINKRETLN